MAGTGPPPAKGQLRNVQAEGSAQRLPAGSDTAGAGSSRLLWVANPGTAGWKSASLDKTGEHLDQAQKSPVFGSN